MMPQLQSGRPRIQTQICGSRALGLHLEAAGRGERGGTQMSGRSRLGVGWQRGRADAILGNNLWVIPGGVLALP